MLTHAMSNRSRLREHLYAVPPIFTPQCQPNSFTAELTGGSSWHEPETLDCEPPHVLKKRKHSTTSFLDRTLKKLRSKKVRKLECPTDLVIEIKGVVSDACDVKTFLTKTSRSCLKTLQGLINPILRTFVAWKNMADSYRLHLLKSKRRKSGAGWSSDTGNTATQ